MITDDLATPAEVLRKHPEIKWNAQQVGSLLWLGLVKGRRMPRYRLVSEADVLKAWQYYKIH